MNWKKHTAIGVSAVATLFIALAYLTWQRGLTINIEPELLILGIAVTAFYSILPDVDSRASQARFVLNAGGITLILAIIAINEFVLPLNQWLMALAIITGLFLLSLNFTRHRGHVHSLAAGALFSLPWVLLDYRLCFFAITGWVLHLAADREFSVF